MKLKHITPFVLALAVAACGNDDEDTSDIPMLPGAEENTLPNVGGSSDCDETLAQYDAFVTEYLDAVNQYLDDEITQDELNKISEKGEAIGDQIQAQGEAGMGAACWQQYTASTMKWSQAAMKISQKAMKEAMEEMKNYGN